MSAGVKSVTKGLVAATLLFASVDLAACQLCIGAFRSSAADQLVEMPQAVLALPIANGSQYRVVEVIKGEQPAGKIIDVAAVQLKAPLDGSSKTLLLVSDKGWPMWVSLGAIGTRHAGWLRGLAAGKRSIEMNEDEWRSRVALMQPYLEYREPLVAEIAYGELAAAPYTALLTLKPRLSAPAIRRWLVDPKLAERGPLYLLLLGIAGSAQDADALERHLEAAWQSADATNLGSMIAANLELRGPARLAWVDAKYMRDHQRSTRELEGVLLALSVHGNANAAIPRDRVIQSYRTFMLEHKDVAGFVAQDLAAWHYWDAVPEYVALMKSNVRQQYPSRVAVVAYLRQSPSGNIIDLALPEAATFNPPTTAGRKIVPLLAP